MVQKVQPFIASAARPWFLLLPLFSHLLERGWSDRSQISNLVCALW